MALRILDWNLCVMTMLDLLAHFPDINIEVWLAV